MKRVLAAVLSIAIASAGCASASGTRTPVQLPTVGDTSAMAEYVQKLPAGSRIRVDRTDGRSMKGTLMRATAQAISVQANTRVPEPPLEIPLNTVTRIQLEGNGGSSTARAVGIGIAAGLGVFFGILAILAASLD
jgi:hypothetical protein